jgi:hypothetical protein
MDPVFTLSYSEYAVVEKITEYLSKRDGFSVYVPVSRQEKNVDFLVHNSNHNRSLRFQVKSSRSYVRDDDEHSVEKNHLKFTLWFSNFQKKYSPGKAEYYVLFGLFPHVVNSSVSSQKESWRSLILCIPDIQMGGLLDSVRTKKENRPDKFFYVAFDSPDQIYGTRGFPAKRDLTEFLLNKQVPNIKRTLTSNPALQPIADKAGSG